MIKWDLLLCGPAFFELALDIDALKEDNFIETPTRDLIRQHYLTLSERLLDAYDKFITNYSDEDLSTETCISILQGFIINIYDKKNTPTYNWIDDKTIPKSLTSVESILEFFYNELLQEDRRPLLIPERRIEQKKKYITVPYNNWRDKNITNQLTRNSYPFDYYASSDEDDSYYSEWFKEIFTGEKHFYIFDSYFMKPMTRKSFLKYILPNMPQKVSITVYCDESVGEDHDGAKEFFDVLKKKTQQNVSQIELINAKLQPEHDRFIYTDHFKLYIGVGLDFISVYKKKVRRGSQLNLNQYRPSELNKLKKNYREEPFFSTKD